MGNAEDASTPPVFIMPAKPKEKIVTQDHSFLSARVIAVS